MRVYWDMVVLLNFLVDFFLLLGTNRLAGYPPAWGRSAIAAGAGALYAGVCVLPSMAFLGNTVWRLASLALMGGLAFGWQRGAVRRTVLFVFLSMALGGIALGLGSGGFPALVAAAAGVCLLCAVGFRGRAGAESYVPVELCYAGKRLCLTALRDTGNTLRDPVTGQQVLVAGADVAAELVGLSVEQLRHPVETMAEHAVAGMCLIPYRAVGQRGSLLLAVRLPEVKIGKQQGAAVVAFAPEGLDRSGTYQILAGGIA